ncbi:MAG TPA: PLP-dependent transferase [Candidatus Baltobacteraceae bacterium]|jgi:cystathionine gamma-synthase/cystathionine gamma-lyase
MPNQTFGRPGTTGFATRAIRAGQDPCAATGATIPPVYQTATFTLENPAATKGFDYSRSGNPTRSALETQLASLEGGRYASAFGSGMAAVAGVASLLSSGDHIVATRDIYGGTHRLFTAVLTRYGIDTTFVDVGDDAALRAAIRPSSRLLWLETPSNPLLKLTDIQRAAGVAKEAEPRIVVAADNTFASPYFQRPLSQGADVVMHSTTKYLCGHSDVIGGVVICDDEDLAARVAYHQNAVGAVPGPWDAYLTLRGVKTLALRMQAHARNAQLVAEFLEGRGDIVDVYYPGLASHPDHDLAKRQMDGFGGVVTLRPRGGVERAHAFAGETKLFNLATSLGGVESLLCVPAKMTHGSLAPEERLELGVTDDLIRLSVGIEEPADLLADLERALDRSDARVPA